MLFELEFQVETPDGVVVNCVKHESPNAKANVVFLHGLTGSRDEADNFFYNAASALSEESVNIFRFDFRGHGSSSHPSNKTTLVGEVIDLKTVVTEIQKMNDLPFVFIGASLGASVLFLFLSDNLDLKVLGAELYNPVLHPRKVFIDPGTDWSRGFFPSNEIDIAKLGEFDFSRDFCKDFESSELSRKI